MSTIYDNNVRDTANNKMTFKREYQVKKKKDSEIQKVILQYNKEYGDENDPKCIESETGLLEEDVERMKKLTT